jgi:hypothetical protein
MATVAVAAVYFNWEFARTNGFSRWLFLGEVVSTAKALVWPYFAFRTDGAAERASSGPSEIDRTRLSSQQISEMEVKKLILAINYSQQGAYLLNSSPHENPNDYPNLEDILAYRRKAVEVGKSADRAVLNSVYPGLGNKFEDEFVEAMSLFVHGCEAHSDEELHRSKVLNDEWADWYQANRKPIEDAANAATGAH